ncbi:MAG TPA: hypothetical protein VM163_11545 [bacterium]|nr:hypothetical protein [bacterium]
MLAAAAIPTQALAASAFLATPSGSTSITVTEGDDFQIALRVSSISHLAAYECKIVITGPATAIGHSTQGFWFSNNRNVFTGFDLGEDPPDTDTTPADYNTAMLMSPLYISGSGAVVVFTLHANAEGTVAINVHPDWFFLADENGDIIQISLPSTLYVTVNASEGDGMGGGEEEQATDEGEAENDEDEETLGDSMDATAIYVDGTNGDDDGDGTAEDPFLTIGKAISEASAATRSMLPGAQAAGSPTPKT